jgi:hypothetical protein
MTRSPGTAALGIDPFLADVVVSPSEGERAHDTSVTIRARAPGRNGNIQNLTRFRMAAPRRKS